MNFTKLFSEYYIDNFNVMIHKTIDGTGCFLTVQINLRISAGEDTRWSA